MRSQGFGGILNRLGRRIGFVIVLIILAGFTFYIRGNPPLMAVASNSMQPTISRGDLILIREKSAYELQEGNIVVFDVPSAIQEQYHYPPIIAHRIIRVTTSGTGIALRTKGDNTGEDPFTVRGEDLKGQVSNRIPYLGFPLLFMQSDYGLIFVIIGLSLLALYLYADELSRGRQTVQRGIFAPVIEEGQRSSRILEQRIETTEKGMVGTQQALNNFASAIAEYAEHLKSHTSAIQGLSEASQELKKVPPPEQNKVLSRLTEVMEQRAPKAEEVKPKVKDVRFPSGCVRSRRQPTEEAEIFRAG